ncbi:hypothetical protein KXD97_28250 [Mycobacterium sp. SMC-8]|uniref:hypothetical protein n=1 Tax=Mycobacterium sp. SMC-8 TaxID=2857060 RepID=UPI0021B24260|nr:hypothetical protein [Mycobacterium sp. SMC-8]UXA11808.1 hypothetical protein KXD97_28250 [Mycobacterium sp. SMC-8]
MSDNNVDPKRAAALRRKYGMDNPPQADNTVVAAINRTDQMYGRLFTRDSAELFDPVRGAALYDVAQEALRNLHAAMGEPADSIDPAGLGHLVVGDDAARIRRVTFDSHDGSEDAFTPLSPDDPALYVHFVGSDLVFVVRGPEQLDAFDRATGRTARPRRGVDYFAPMLQIMMEMHDQYWDRPCDVNVSRSCDGATQLVPYRAGAILLLFEVCGPCMTYAEAAAATGYEMSVMEAHARVGLPFP